MALRSALPAGFQLPAGVSVGLPSARRLMRRPQHRFGVRAFPWNIQPVAIAPVLPGDTLEGARIQARIATDPVASKLGGWWTELHLFYVKHRDTAYSTELQNMVLDPSAGSGVPTVAGGAGATYRLNGRPDYVQLCLNTVTDWFFRDEGEDHTNFVDAISGLPLAKVGVQDWTQGIVQTSLLTADDVEADINNDGTLMASEIQSSLTQWQWMVQNQLTDMTYEDWLGTYGVRVQSAVVQRPELLRSIRAWTYPTNTITQGTGAVSSAAVWSIAEEVKKKRFFKEPGWLLLVSVTKPKFFRGRQPGSFGNVMDTAYTWLPAVLRDDPYTSIVPMDTVSGALPKVTLAGGVSADVRDLLLYGDQFMAAAPTVSGGDTVAAGSQWTPPTGETITFLPIIGQVNDTTGRADYPAGTAAERQAVFKGTTDLVSKVQIDGIITFDIASSVQDMSPGVPTRT